MDDKKQKNVSEDEVARFRKLLANHDWYYHYSDDHRVWHEGRREAAEIEQYLKRGEPFTSIYSEFVKRKFPR